MAVSCDFCFKYISDSEKIIVEESLANKITRLAFSCLENSGFLDLPSILEKIGLDVREIIMKKIQ